MYDRIIEKRIRKMEYIKIKQCFSEILFFILIIISLFQCRNAFAGGQQEAGGGTICDRYFFDVEDKFEIPVFFNTGNLEESRIHKITLGITLLNDLNNDILETIQQIVITSDLFSDTIIIPHGNIQNQYVYDTNETDSDNGVLINIVNIENNKFDIEIIKKPNEINYGTIDTDGEIRFLIDLLLENQSYRVITNAYNINNEHIYSIENYNTTLRFDIPPEVKIRINNQNSGYPSNTFFTKQRISVYRDLRKTYSSSYNSCWLLDNCEFEHVSDYSFELILDEVKEYHLELSITDDLNYETSDFLDLKILKNDAPTIPEIIYPIEDDIIDTENSIFYWRPSTDPENHDIEYIVEISENVNFDLIINDSSIKLISYLAIIPFLSFFSLKRIKRKYLLVMLVFTFIFFSFLSCPLDSNQDAIYENLLSYEFNNLEKNKTYYWRVKAIDEYDNYSTSSVVKFITR